MAFLKSLLSFRGGKIGQREIGEPSDNPLPEVASTDEYGLNELLLGENESLKLKCSDQADQIQSLLNSLIQIQTGKGVSDQLEAFRNSIQATKSEAEKDLSQIFNLLNRLEKASSDITQIADIVNKIANQTNLLALNASIEAERAGRNGVGFRIVANEVKALALKTKDSISEIKVKVGAVQNASSETVQQISHFEGILNQFGESVSNLTSAVHKEESTLKSETESHHGEVELF